MADYESWQVAGYDWQDSWRDIEHGDPAPSEWQLEYIDTLVISVRDADGVDHYYTIDGPFEDWDSIEEYIDDEIMAMYGADF